MKRLQSHAQNFSDAFFSRGPFDSAATLGPRLWQSPAAAACARRGVGILPTPCVRDTLRLELRDTAQHPLDCQIGDTLRLGPLGTLRHYHAQSAEKTLPGRMGRFKLKAEWAIVLPARSRLHENLDHRWKRGRKSRRPARIEVRSAP